MLCSLNLNGFRILEHKTVKASDCFGIKIFSSYIYYYICDVEYGIELCNTGCPWTVVYPHEGRNPFMERDCLNSMHDIINFMHLHAYILNNFNGVLAPEYNEKFSSHSFGNQ